jgi:Mn2+/Fe2+ NRAMP family transporter
VPTDPILTSYSDPTRDMPGDPPRARKRRGSRRLVLPLLALAGPGIISASAGNDAGGIATYASAGSQFGYRTLFFMVIVTVAYVAVQEMTARLAVHTGKGLAALIREQFALRWTAVAMVCFAIANLGLTVTEFAGIGAAFGLFGISRYVAVPIAAVAIWLLVVFGSYRYAERIFILLTLVFVTYPLAMVLGHPHWTVLASSLVLPHFESSRAYVLLGVALIGTTITPYIQLYQAGALVDRGVGPTDLPRARIDAVGGAVVSDIVSMCIIAATAAAIGGSGVLTSAKEAAQALRPVAGSAAEALFGIGLLGASALAAAVVPLSTAYALAEAVGVERSVSRSFREAPLFLGVFSSQIAIGALVVLVPGNLIQLIVNTQVLEGLITPVTLTFIFVLACRRRLLGDAVNGPFGRVVGFVSVAGVGAFSLVLVVLAVLGWFGAA